VFASTASTLAASELKPACSSLNPPSTAANVSVTLLIAAACAAACAACPASAAASASVTLAFTAAWAANSVDISADKRESESRLVSVGQRAEPSNFHSATFKA